MGVQIHALNFLSRAFSSQIPAHFVRNRVLHRGCKAENKESKTGVAG